MFWNFKKKTAVDYSVKNMVLRRRISNKNYLFDLDINVKSQKCDIEKALRSGIINEKGVDTEMIKASLTETIAISLLSSHAKILMSEDLSNHTVSEASFLEKINKDISRNISDCLYVSKIAVYSECGIGFKFEK